MYAKIIGSRMCYKKHLHESARSTIFDVAAKLKTIDFLKSTIFDMAAKVDTIDFLKITIFYMAAKLLNF